MVSVLLIKRQPYRNKKILNSARDENCCAQFPGCLNETSTTVFCHLNESWAGKGMSQKADDCAGFFGCVNCHDLYDGRKHDLQFFNQRDSYVLQAYYRTIRRLIDLNILK